VLMIWADFGKEDRIEFQGNCNGLAISPSARSGQDLQVVLWQLDPGRACRRLPKTRPHAIQPGQFKRSLAKPSLSG